MYRELLALFKAKSQNGEDVQEVVNGAALAIRKFAITNSGMLPVEKELARLAKIITDGE